MSAASQHRSGNIFWYALAAYLALEITSLAGYFHPWLQVVGVAAAALAALALSLWQPRFGVYLVLAELFIGGKGYLLSLHVAGVQLSLRMILWLVVLGVWLSTCVRRGERQTPAPLAPVGLPLAAWLLGATVVVGVLQGLLRYPLDRVFFDANAWLFFLLLPLFLKTFREANAAAPIVPMLNAAVVMLAVKTLLLVSLFGHLELSLLEPLYRWVRDTGVGEITHVQGSLWRVFFQSHLYSMVGGLVIFSALLQRQLPGRWPAVAAGSLLYLASLTVVASQSRSLWLGSVVALVLLITVAVHRRRLSFLRGVLVTSLLAVTMQSQFSVVALVSGNVGANIFRERLRNLGTEPASSSRRSQLGPLVAAVAQRPFLGAGFGRQVTYQSADPRVRQSNVGGWYTTSAFEWGYLDIALKIGGLGLAFYLLWLTQLSTTLLNAQPRGGLALGVGVALVAIAVTNVVSPYLNHPLGIGWVLLVAALSQTLPYPRREPTNVG